MINRKNFIKTSLLAGLLPVGRKLSSFSHAVKVNKPVVISTWAPNIKANQAAWEILSGGGSALDAVEAGARVPEEDPEDHSVGLGGFPDRSGKVTLDACVMNEEGRCGSVVFLEHILHPVSVARKVMEETPHVILAGEGALEFALAQGFEKQELLTQEARNAWREWKKKQEEKPVDEDNHDTIGILALDGAGNLSGACTTSGASYKMRGRVGDSPIIGAGLFVDNEAGAATATGVGEEVIRIVGSHLVVELMRQGRSPQQACEEAVGRIIKNNPDRDDLQVGFIALRKDGRFGAFSVKKGFTMALHDSDGERVIESKSRLK